MSNKIDLGRFDESTVPLLEKEIQTTPGSWIEAILQPWCDSKSLDSLAGRLHPQEVREQGFFVDENGNTYKGQFVNGKLEGQGALVYNNGDVYTGQFAGGLCKGQGILKYNNGNVYTGEFDYGVPNGRGTCKYNNGDVYEGQWAFDTFHGQGIFKYGSGDVYIGQFRKGRFEGRGSYQFTNINKSGFTRYEANFVEGLAQGKAFFYSLKEIKEVFIRNGQITNLDRSNIGDFLFFSLLYGMPNESGNGEVAFGYAHGILADYLLHYFRNDPDSLKIVTPLSEAYHLAAMTPEERKSTISEKLQKNEPCLIRYGFRGHAMLLNLLSSKDGQFIDCEVFNSGGGLGSYHTRNQINGKYQTKKIIRIPKSGLTPDKLEQLINYGDFQNAGEAYHVLLDIQGAQCIEPDTAIYQKAQVSKNCSVESDFSYLRDKLPTYKKMRRDLFQDALIARCKQEKGCIKNSRVQHKIRTLSLRYTPFGNRNHVKRLFS